MKTIQCIFVLSIVDVTGAAFANDAPPSDASIQQLTTLSRSQEVLTGMKSQMDARITSSMKEASQGRTITPERQSVLDQMLAKMVAAYGDAFNAQAMQMVMIRVYQATYTQEEVDGLTAFYKTPAGQALINKAPLMMQNTMQEMRALMRPLSERMAQKLFGKGVTLRRR
jgi:uncharacterized protein